MGNELTKIDRYTIKERIGGGGFSDVYLVDGPQGECALKLLKEVSESKGMSALQEFKNEFAVLKNLNHPNIARILDFGFDEQLHRYFYTSEMIRGSTLYEATKNLAIEEITDLIVQALRALEYLHSFRVYHFDIKAANALVVAGEEPTVKLIDFGLAGIDPRGRLIGTPSYMSPEIINREPADGRADLYSLGVLWYFCLARYNPFRSKITRETLQNQVHLMPPPPSELNGDIPTWIDATILRLLQKNPAKRFSVAARVLREINRFSEKKYPLETRETLVSYLPQEGELIGRVREMETVREELKAIIHGGAKFRGIIIEGALGSGKTRLMREFKYEAQLGDVRVQMASAADAEGYARWCETLSHHLDSGEDVEIFALDDVEMVVHDEEAAKQLVPLIARARRPSGDARVLLILGMRDGGNGAEVETIRSIIPAKLALANFTPAELTTYLSSLTGLEEPPKALVDGIFRRTEGNPLFVTEVLKALITEGVLFDEGGRWRATVFEDVGVDFSRVAVPHSLEELLLDEVEKLKAAERSMMEALAVVGKPSGGDELSSYADVLEPYPLLARLVQADFLERTDDHQYVFKNELLGQMLCARMSPTLRASYHSRIAAYLKKNKAKPEIVEHHISFGKDRKAALVASIHLGDLYLKRGLGSRATHYLARASELIDESDIEAQIDVSLKHGEALLIAHDYVKAEELFSSLDEMLKGMPDSERSARGRIDVLKRLGGTYMKTLDFDKARAAFNEAKQLLRKRVVDHADEIGVQNFLGSVLMSEGRYGDARGVFERTREMWRRLSSEDRAKVTNNDLGLTLLMLGERDKARAVLQEDLSFAEELEDDMLISRAHYNLAQLAMGERQIDDAIGEYEECVEVCRRSENTELLLRAYNGLGNIFHLRGELDKSLDYYERGLALHERVGDPRGGAAISVNMGIIESSRDNYDAAMDLLVPAVEFLGGVADKTDVDWAAFARGLLEMGDVQRKQERYDDAIETLGRAYDIADAHAAASKNRFWILATLGEVAKEQGNDEALSSLLERMRLIAESDDEKKQLAELEVSIGREPSSATSASESSVESVSDTMAPMEGAGKEQVAGQRISSSVYERVLEINKLINAERDLNYVLKTVIFYAIEFTGAEAGAVILLDDSGELAIAGQRNMAGEDEEFAFSKSLARSVLSSGIPLKVSDALSDDRFAGEKSVSAYKLASILCIPIKAKGRVIGVMYLDHRYRSRAFEKVDMMLLDAFADQAGLAIENARLIAELSERVSKASGQLKRYEDMLSGRAFEPLMDYGALVAKSSAMQGMIRILDKIADTDISVLLVGESGVGKELIARALHENHASRKKRKFVAINCAAIPSTLIESELFGYKAGAFTGAQRDKKGLIEEAAGGTLFFDEIGELEPALQVKLLRVLQEREFVRVGDTKTVRCDVRVVAATNRDIDALIKEGGFRKDLYYRLCQVKIVVPPLRERQEDIPVLAEHIVADAAAGRTLIIDRPLMKKFFDYSWPGNVRELQNLIQVAAALAEGDVISMESIPHTAAFAQFVEHGRIPRAEPPTVPSMSGVESKGQGVFIDRNNVYEPTKTWRDYEKLIVAKAFATHDYHAAQAAVALGISTATMYKRITEYDLKDRENEIYREPFVYDKAKTLDEYLPLIFKAALDHAGGRPTQAIANLSISQGYFYKVMKTFS